VPEPKPKPMVEGMYTVHRMYSVPKMSPEEKRIIQIEQHRRCESKRQARKNAERILAGTHR
jgi:hypothetical protein